MLITKIFVFILIKSVFFIIKTEKNFFIHKLIGNKNHSIIAPAISFFLIRTFFVGKACSMIALTVASLLEPNL